MFIKIDKRPGRMFWHLNSQVVKKSYTTFQRNCEQNFVYRTQTHLVTSRLFFSKYTVVD